MHLGLEGDRLPAADRPPVRRGAAGPRLRLGGKSGQHRPADWHHLGLRPRVPSGKEAGPTCPVRATQAWLEVFNEAPGRPMTPFCLLLLRRAAAGS